MTLPKHHELQFFKFITSKLRLIEASFDDIEVMTEAKGQVVTGMNDAKIDGQDIIRRLDRIEKVVDGLVVIHKKEKYCCESFVQAYYFKIQFAN